LPANVRKLTNRLTFAWNRANLSSVARFSNRLSPKCLIPEVTLLKILCNSMIHPHSFSARQKLPRAFPDKACAFEELLE
jgi:hypothetical protein